MYIALPKYRLYSENDKEEVTHGLGKRKSSEKFGIAKLAKIKLS